MGITNISDAVARRKRQLLLMFLGLAFMSFMIPLAVVLVMFGTFHVPSGAMENTLLVGDRVIVRKVLYAPVERGDVVVFVPPGEQGRYSLRRCVAVAGDRLAIKDGALYLNGAPVTEGYARGKTRAVAAGTGAGVSVDGVVPRGKIAVLGDNREHSTDSRNFGLVDEAGVAGKAVLVYWNAAEVARSGLSHLGMVR